MKANLFGSQPYSILFLLLFFLPPRGWTQVINTWALGDGEKVFRDDKDHPSRKGNFIWDGKTIHLRGLYNEVLGFQVIVETGLSGAKGIELSVQAPVHKSSGSVIGGNSLKYGPGG